MYLEYAQLRIPFPLLLPLYPYKGQCSPCLHDNISKRLVCVVLSPRYLDGVSCHALLIILLALPVLVLSQLSLAVRPCSLLLIHEIVDFATEDSATVRAVPIGVSYRTFSQRQRLSYVVWWRWWRAWIERQLTSIA